MMHDYYDRLEAQLVMLTERGAHLGDVRLSRRRTRPRVAGIVAVIVSVAVVIGVGVMFLAARTGPGPAAPAHEVPTDGVDPVLVRDLRLLRRPLRASDQLPSAFKARPTGVLLVPASPPGQMSPSMLGLLPLLARRATIPSTGVSVWLIPGRRGLCWDAEDHTGRLAGGVCTSPTQTNATLIDSAPIAVGGRLTVGLVTDQVRSLVEIDAKGKQHPIPFQARCRI
jgi:hypothetical protein